MDEQSVEFASLLASRLCHDLLSPIGALNNGIELLADEHDPEMRARCMELLAESARTSATKLKFFRLAFGAAGGFEDEIDTREARTAIEGLVGTQGRVELNWMVEQPSMSKAKIKILLNLALIAADALVRGGTLLVGAEDGEIVVRAEGERLILDPELKNALLGKTSEDALTPRAAAAWLVHVLTKQGGGEIQVSEPEDHVLLFGATFGG
ncbi:MAG: histidine phosphotransferase [Sphingomonadaceae bacterium]|nr:histidine phosphotransferase [Sphingomonadaceae bacterium]